jgi:SAM-dependent methyltransferase
VRRAVSPEAHAMELEIPSDALPYIAMHRTHLRGDLARLYASDVLSDFESLMPYLPQTAAASLDIGCGMAAIDVLLWRHYANPTIHLLDGTGHTDVRILFHPVMSPYNSMPVARQLLERNGVPHESVVEWPPEPQAAVPACDLVISLLSWGFHYPVSTYLPLVERCLRPGGRLILDVRKGQGGLEALSRSLRQVAIISTTVKADRACFEPRAGA